METNVIDERHPGKVSGVFHDEHSAEAARNMLEKEGGVTADKINLVEPGDLHADEKLEPDDEGIARTLVKSHAVLGVIGFAIGLLLATALVTFGPKFTQSSPLMVYIVLALLGPFIGMMIAGLVSLRPDHDRVVNETRSAAAQNEWVVVVQTDDHDESSRVKKLLEKSAIKVVSSV